MRHQRGTERKMRNVKLVVGIGNILGMLRIMDSIEWEI